MGEEISDELKAKARDEAIERMLKAGEDKPEEKGFRWSWGPIFGHGGAYKELGTKGVIVSVDGSSTMAVIAHVTGSSLDEIVQLPPGGESIIFGATSQGIKVDMRGVGTEDQYAFGKLEVDV